MITDIIFFDDEYSVCFVKKVRRVNTREITMSYRMQENPRIERIQ